MVKGYVHKFRGQWHYYIINDSTRATEYQGDCDTWDKAYRRTYDLVSVLRPWPSRWPTI